MVEQTNEELLSLLGAEVEVKKKVTRSAKEERIIAGFEEIQNFINEHDRIPRHGEENDIFERLYATRLDQINASLECMTLLKEFDTQNILENAFGISEPEVPYNSDKEILDALGVELPKEGDVTFLKHVTARSSIDSPDEVATRQVCKDFDIYKPLFATINDDLKNKVRSAELIQKQPIINKGDWFVMYGQIAYVAQDGDLYVDKNNRKNKKVYVIFDNGTEIEMLMRSMQRALEKDGTGRRIIALSAGPLFAGEIKLEDSDVKSGTIYVLRSLSQSTKVLESQKVIHKIGVTTGEVKKRISSAKVDPTYLMADVELVASYPLVDINPKKLEKLIHNFFADAKLDIEIKDRFGKAVIPQEWFLVPLNVIDELVDRIQDGTAMNYKYDLQNAKLIKL